MAAAGGASAGTSASVAFPVMSSIDEIAEQYVARAAELDPVMATDVGIAGYDDRMTDLSPAGFAARAELDRATVTAMDAAVAADERERVARAAMLERLGLDVERYDAGDVTSELNVVASQVQDVRMIFDLMPVGGEEAQHNLAARMAAVPDAYAGLRRTYAAAARQGRVAAARQVAACARQCADWSAPGTGFYTGLAERTGATGALRAELDKAAAAASAATAELGRFLEAELLPLAPRRDAAGRDRYALASRYFLGAAIDLDEAYAWGWGEVIRLKAEMARVADRIDPGWHAGRRCRRARRGSVAPDHRPGEPAGLDAGVRRRCHHRAERHPLRHPGAGPPHRVHDRPDQQRGDLLHRPERGLDQARPDVVGARRRR